jgi:hypothetical protein
MIEWMNEWMKHIFGGWNKYTLPNDFSVIILLIQADNSSAKKCNM